MRSLSLAALSIALACGTAHGAEGDYSLDCSREVVPLQRAKAKRTDAPFVARIHFTGKTRIRPNAPGEQGEQRMEDLVLSIRGKQLQGGLVQGPDSCSVNSSPGAVAGRLDTLARRPRFSSPARRR